MTENKEIQAEYLFQNEVTSSQRIYKAGILKIVYIFDKYFEVVCSL